MNVLIPVVVLLLSSTKIIYLFTDIGEDQRTVIEIMINKNLVIAGRCSFFFPSLYCMYFL